MTTSTCPSTVTTYSLKASNGRHIRRATKVIFADGRTVEFTERLGVTAARTQAARILATS